MSSPHRLGRVSSFQAPGKRAASTTPNTPAAQLSNLVAVGSATTKRDETLDDRAQTKREEKRGSYELRAKVSTDSKYLKVRGGGEGENPS